MQRAYDWLSQAQEDLAAAQTSHEGNRYEWSCFQAQQSGEKALKALLLARNMAVREHSLLHLCKELERLDLKPPGEVWGGAQELDRHYIPTRYPNGFASGYPAEYYSEKLSSLCLEHARNILDFARRALAELAPSE